MCFQSAGGFGPPGRQPADYGAQHAPDAQSFPLQQSQLEDASLEQMAQLQAILRQTPGMVNGMGKLAAGSNHHL
jgi:hypothetical protein